MKTNHSSRLSRSILGFIFASIFLLSFSANLNLKVCAEEGGNVFPTFDDILASAHAQDLQTFGKVGSTFDAELKRLQTDLLSIFSDPKSSNIQKCSAAYYLGVTRAPEAAEPLAANITLELDMSQYKMDGFPVIIGETAKDALIKIGIPAIPALIGVLGRSDDAHVRDLTLKVLRQIEGDKDVVQLRLQKSVLAEKEPQRQARLRLALKALGGLN